MHGNSLNIMREFIEKYFFDEELKILDLGSRVVDGHGTFGSYRQFFTNQKWQYIGADIEGGDNVDVVMMNGYKFPFDDGNFSRAKF